MVLIFFLLKQKLNQELGPRLVAVVMSMTLSKVIFKMTLYISILCSCLHHLDHLSGDHVTSVGRGHDKIITSMFIYDHYR